MAMLGTLLLTGPPAEADQESGAQMTESEFPAQWIVLVSRPNLWPEPGGERSEQPLRADALDRVWVDKRAGAGEDSTVWLRVALGRDQGWLPEALLAPLPLDITASELEAVGREPVDRFHGIPAGYVPPDLVAVQPGYEPEVRYRLRSPAAQALKNMVAAARRDSIQLQIVSAYRSYERQLEIYLAKLDRSGWNQKTVAKPGHSEHQLGTALDLTGSDDDPLLEGSFGATEAGKWLARRAPEFGFAISYTAANSSETGYSPEPWHYRYYGVGIALQRHRAAMGR